MKIYNYHPITKEYITESEADQSPLEPGVFLIPAHATTIQPPDFSNNQKCFFVDDAWLVEEIQEPQQPEIIPEDLLLLCKRKALELLRATDQVQLPDVRATISNAQEIDSYRSAVRKLLYNPVENPVWPEKPVEVHV